MVRCGCRNRSVVDSGGGAVMDIHVNRIAHSGGIELSTLVAGDGMRWFERQTYYGYTLREAKRMFREHVKANGWKAVD